MGNVTATKLLTENYSENGSSTEQNYIKGA